jgi:hypothetical protein
MRSSFLVVVAADLGKLLHPGAHARSMRASFPQTILKVLRTPMNLSEIL